MNLLPHGKTIQHEVVELIHLIRAIVADQVLSEFSIWRPLLQTSLHVICMVVVTERCKPSSSSERSIEALDGMVRSEDHFR